MTRCASERGRRMSQHPPFAWSGSAVSRSTNDRTSLVVTMVGAAVAVGFCVFLATLLGIEITPPLRSLTPIAVIGALCTGACSLLSHHRRNQPT